MGLVMFCAIAFAVPDTGLRNTLIGGLTASVGAAVAFYFSTKSSEDARRDMMGVQKDMLDAATGTETVPNLKGLPKQEAVTKLGTTSLKLQVAPGSPEDGRIRDQDPTADSVVRKGSAVVVTLEPNPQS